MDGYEVLIVAGGMIVVAALAYEAFRVAREERAWKEDEKLARAALADARPGRYGHPDGFFTDEDLKEFEESMRAINGWLRQWEGEERARVTRRDREVRELSRLFELPCAPDPKWR